MIRLRNHPEIQNTVDAKRKESKNVLSSWKLASPEETAELPSCISPLPPITCRHHLTRPQHLLGKNVGDSYFCAVVIRLLATG